MQADLLSPWGNGVSSGLFPSAAGTTIVFELTMLPIGVPSFISIMGFHGSKPGGMSAAEVQRPTALELDVFMAGSRVGGLKDTRPLLPYLLPSNASQ